MSKFSFFNVVTTIAGDAGAGKTTSMRNLGRNALLYNVEQKELPFPQKQNGIIDKKIGHPTEMFLHIPMVMLRPDIDTIVLDSFSHTVNYFKFKTQYEDKKGGYDIYRGYNDMIYALFELCKKMMNKYIYVLAHAESFDMPDGTKQAFIKVDGKMYEKCVEQFAIIALSAQKQKVMVEGGKQKHRYVFEADSFTATTKAPMGMFEGDMDNDIQAVQEQTAKFWNHPNRAERILLYTNEAYTTELIKRMEDMKPFFKGPLNLDGAMVDKAFNDAYNSIPAIMDKIVRPTAEKLTGQKPATVIQVEQPVQQQQPAQQAEPAQQVPQQPAPQATAPAPVQQAQPSAQSPAPGGLPTPGQSISAVDALINSTM